MNIAYPLSITDEGLVATTSYSQHIEQLIEQVLFTTPGERVNLPDFGTGITQLIFNPGNAEMVSATQFLIQGALQQWLGNLIQVQAVQVVAEDSTLNVTIQYIVKQTKQPRVASYTR
jgi:phage baseplate assembly protein W